MLLSLTFGYSNGKHGKEYGGMGYHERRQYSNSSELNSNERIKEVTIYEDDRNITNSWRMGNLSHIIVGIRLRTSQARILIFGSTNGTSRTELFNDYYLGYVQGKAGSHIDSLSFTWYKSCFVNSTIIE